jgi:hypothetical protein
MTDSNDDGTFSAATDEDTVTTYRCYQNRDSLPTHALFSANAATAGVPVPVLLRVLIAPGSEHFDVFGQSTFGGEVE